MVTTGKNLPSCRLKNWILGMSSTSLTMLVCNGVVSSSVGANFVYISKLVLNYMFFYVDRSR